MRLITLHDILVAWRDGQLELQDALSRAQLQNETELREAAMLSGVLPVRPLTDDELEHQALIRRLQVDAGLGTLEGADSPKRFTPKPNA